MRQRCEDAGVNHHAARHKSRSYLQYLHVFRVVRGGTAHHEWTGLADSVKDATIWPISNFISPEKRLSQPSQPCLYTTLQRDHSPSGQLDCSHNFVTANSGDPSWHSKETHDPLPPSSRRPLASFPVIQAPQATNESPCLCPRVQMLASQLSRGESDDPVMP